MYGDRLPYVEATILEVLRYKTVGPVTTRRTMRDTEVGGYFIPAESTVSRFTHSRYFTGGVYQGLKASTIAVAAGAGDGEPVQCTHGPW